MAKLTTTNRAKFSALKTAKSQAKHLELAHTEALEMNAKPVLHKNATEKAQGLELSKEQRLSITRAANAGDLNTAEDLRNAAYEQATKDVKSGAKSTAEAISALRELFGAEFSAEYFQDLEMDGLKKIKDNAATMKDAGRAVKGSEGRWTFKVKEFKAEAIEWLEEHIELDTFKSEALQARSRMNRFVPLVNFAATGSTGKRKDDFEQAFFDKLSDHAETVRMGYLTAQAGQKTDTYANNLGRVLVAFGAAQLDGSKTGIRPNYDHPLIKAIAERA